MVSRRWGRFVSAALALTLILGTVPALAADGDPTVAAGVTVAGVSLVGMTAVQAHDAIVAACATPTLAPLVTDAAGTPLTLQVSSAVKLDVDRMVADALAASVDTTLVATWTVDPAAVSAFIAAVADETYRKPVDAQRTVRKKRLKVSAPVDGRAVDKAAAAVLVTSAIGAEIAAGGAAQPIVAIPTLVLLAKGPLTLGKTIIVVLKERKVYLYKNSKIEKSYRCAVGQRAYPTPLGTWKIVRKLKNPSWHNNGADWAKRMPWFIAPGRNNPLGTRALYLNAPGIRIHGIPASENRSIGHAASHGCIRLKNSDAIDIYPRVPVGTPVFIVS